MLPPSPELVEGLAAFIDEREPTPGSVHIVVHDEVDVLSAMTVLLLRRAVNTEVWAIVPPRYDVTGLRDSLVRTLGEAAETALAQFVVRSPANAGVEALLERLAGVPSHAVVIVAEAERYHVIADAGRVRGHAPSPLGVTMGVRLAADVWVPSLSSLASALRARPWALDVHVLLLVGKQPPTTDEHLEALDRCCENSMMITISGRVDEAALTTQIFAWGQVLRDHGIDELRAQIAAYTADSLVRAQALARCLTLASRWEEAYRAVEPVLDELRAGPPALLHFLASVALYTGRLEEARADLLRLAVADDVDENTLLNAHKLASQGRDERVQTELLDRMRADFPRSLYLLRVALFERYVAKDFPAVVELGAQLAGDPEFPLYCAMIERAAYLCALGKARPEELLDRIRAVAPDWSEYARSELADDAMAEGRLLDALALLCGTQPNAPHARLCALACCRLLPAMSADESIDMAPRFAALDLVLGFVSDHAEDIDVGAELAQILSVEHMGSLGWRMLLDRLATEVDAPLVRRAPLEQGEAVAEVSLEALFSFVQARYIEGGPQAIHLRPETLLDAPSTAELKALLNRALDTLPAISGMIDGAGTALVPQIVAKATLDLWHTVRERGVDLRETTVIEVLNVVGQGLANAGMVQEARDHGNLVLTYAGSHASVEMKRCGWIAHADLQLRTGHVGAAILGLLCARAQTIDAQVASERYNELFLLVRLLRTLGAIEPALSRIPALRAVVSELGAPNRLMRKVDDLETGLRFASLTSASHDNPVVDRLPELHALVAAACRSTEIAIAANEEVLIPASLLAQLIRLGEQVGADLTAARGLFDRAVADLPPTQRDGLRALASPRGNVSSLLQLARGPSRARSAADLGASLERVHVACRHLLGGPCDPEEALTAIELLADPSLESGAALDIAPEEQQRSMLFRQIQRGYHFLSHGPDAVSGAFALPDFVVRGDEFDASDPISNTVADPERLHRFACALGSGDYELVTFALVDRNLVHVDARDGRLAGPWRVSLPGFDGEPLSRWRTVLSRALMRADGDDADIHDIEAAMGGLGVTAPPAGPRTVVYLLTHPLTVIPANLLLRNGALSGMQGPVAVVPSLSWLLESRRRPSRATGRRAWILPSGPDAGPWGGPLALLADNLPERLPGFVTTIDFPVLENPLEVAVLAAHGSLDDSGLYFRTIADERARRFAIPRVAEALGGCELVVLFVCNGGRNDAAPFSARSVGLPSALLRAGCRTVIASPWPLDAFVVVRWASLFLDSWTVDTDVAAAVHRANLKLLGTHPHPRDFLAMHVFGDPALRPRQ